MSDKANLAAGIILTAVLLAGCDSRAPAPANNSATDREAARESLIEADLAFSQLAVEKGLPEAYLEYLAEDAVQLPDGDLPIAGKDAIYANILAVTGSSDFELSWEPIAAEVSAAGDLGYTWGTYTFEALDEAGERVAYEGKYANFWERTAAGYWRILLDISNQNYSDYSDDLNSVEGEGGQTPEPEAL